MLQQKIKDLANQYAPDFISIRRHLHAHPELSYKEFETSKYVQQKLAEYNIPFQVKATTGVIGLLKGKSPAARVVALRADMDAFAHHRRKRCCVQIAKSRRHACLWP
jgi:hippurate hydrolase